MKIAVLADIHSNWPALQVVSAHVDAWHPDLVVVAGDVVNRGPRPQECLQFVQERIETEGWQVVRGNHEDFVLKQAQPGAPLSGPEFDIAQNSFWTYQQLSDQLASLEGMPFQVTLTGVEGEEIRVVHASMRNNRDGIYPWTEDDELRQKINPPPALLCVGHTHRPIVRQIDDTLVINVGAVGMPFDGDQRAAYAQLVSRKNSWRTRIVRLAYDKAQTERDFFDTGFIAGAGDLARLFLLELRQAMSHVHLWQMQYEKAVLSGEITLADSVRAYLASNDSNLE